MVACTVTGGRGRSNSALAVVEARLASTSDVNGAIARPTCHPRRHNHKPISTATIDNDTKLPNLLMSFAALMSRAVR